MHTPATHRHLQLITPRMIAADLKRREARRRDARGRLTAFALSGRSTRSPSVARRQVAEHLTRWHIDDVQVAAARLIVSELVTNAVRHTTSPTVRVEVAVIAGRVYLTVTDRGPRRPIRAGHATANDESGRGLHLVQQLSSRCGHRPHGSGTRAFAVLPATAQEAAA